MAEAAELTGCTINLLQPTETKLLRARFVTRQSSLLDHVLAYKITLTLLHSERPKVYAILFFLSAIGLIKKIQHEHG